MKETGFTGEWITLDAHKKIQVPSNPNIGFIEGDGTGPDIWAASRPVFEAAVLEHIPGQGRFTGSNSLRVKGPQETPALRCRRRPSI